MAEELISARICQAQWSDGKKWRYEWNTAHQKGNSSRLPAPPYGRLTSNRQWPLYVCCKITF